MAQVQQIPLGGTDYAGNPLPPTGTFYTPDSQQGPGGWAPFAPPSPTQQTAAPQVPQDQQGQGPGGWAAFTPPQAPPPEKQIGATEAAGRGALDALSFGSYPALSGAAAASGIQTPTPSEPASFPVNISGVDTVPMGSPGETAETLAASAAQVPVGAARLAINAVSGTPDQSIVDRYNQAREQALKEQEAAQQQHPAAYLGGQVGGSLLAVPGAGALKAVTTIGRIAKSAKVGAIGGGLYGGGTAASEGGSLTDVGKGVAGGAAAGATLGGILGSSIEGVSNVGSKVASIVRGARNDQAEAGSRVLTGLSKDREVLSKKVSDTPALNAGSNAGTPLFNVDFGGENTHALL